MNQEKFSESSLKERFALKKIEPILKKGDSEIYYTLEDSFDTYDALLQIYNDGSIVKLDKDDNNIIDNSNINNNSNIIENIDKKKLVIFIVQKFVQLNVLNPDEINILNSFAQNILPNVIDTLCSIDTKKIVINAEQKVKTCCLPFF